MKNCRDPLVIGALLLIPVFNLVLAWLATKPVGSGAVSPAAGFVGNLVLVAVIAFRIRDNRHSLFRPIQSIADWASHIRQGDFSARLQANHPDLDGLQDDINRLAEWLESLVELKDQEVYEHAERLNAQIRVLHLLYDFSGNVVRSTDIATFLQQTMEPLVHALDAGKVEMMSGEGDDEPVNCEFALADVDSQEVSYRDISIPLEFGGNAHGECRLWFREARFPLADEFNQLLYALGQGMGMAIEKIHLEQEAERLSQIRERTRIANELHDSLAQTIAGLRIQIRILDEVLHQQDEPAVWGQMERVENMLEEAHTELRSLIGYFQAPVDSGGLVPAINTLLARFRRESDINVFFQNNWDVANLPDSLQLEVLRIIQEALTNIRKHSHAENARIMLRRENETDLSVLVEDDGIGIVESSPLNGPGEHVGLSVMRQRANSIGAELQIESEAGEGTQILISFSVPPQ